VRTLIFLAFLTIPLAAAVTKLPVHLPANITETSSVRALELAAGTIIVLAGITITKQQPMLTDKTAWGVLH
jgi:peptidoglycan/LPS O-acetylase OafA/YrhL